MPRRHLTRERNREDRANQKKDKADLEREKKIKQEIRAKEPVLLIDLFNSDAVFNKVILPILVLTATGVKRAPDFKSFGIDINHIINIFIKQEENAFDFTLSGEHFSPNFKKCIDIQMNGIVKANLRSPLFMSSFEKMLVEVRQPMHFKCQLAEDWLKTVIRTYAFHKKTSDEATQEIIRSCVEKQILTDSKNVEQDKRDAFHYQGGGIIYQAWHYAVFLLFLAYVCDAISDNTASYSLVTAVISVGLLAPLDTKLEFRRVEHEFSTRMRQAVIETIDCDSQSEQPASAIRHAKKDNARDAESLVKKEEIESLAVPSFVSRSSESKPKSNPKLDEHKKNNKVKTKGTPSFFPDTASSESVTSKAAHPANWYPINTTMIKIKAYLVLNINLDARLDQRHAAVIKTTLNGNLKISANQQNLKRIQGTRGNYVAYELRTLKTCGDIRLIGPSFIRDDVLYIVLNKVVNAAHAGQHLVQQANQMIQSFDEDSETQAIDTSSSVSSKYSTAQLA